MGMPVNVQKLHKETVQDLIDDEVEAIEGYDKAIVESDNPEAIEVYEHIKDEEEEHIAELEGLDKMKPEEITSEQAWEDFKSGYSDFEEKHIGKDREGDEASLEEKIDVLSAKISELNTDMSRLTDSVPQALGTIEEGKTLEEEAEESEEAEELGEESSLFGDEDDGLGEIFGEEEEVTDENGEPIEESEDDEAVDDEEIPEDEETTEETVNDTEIDEEPSEDGEEDYIPIEDLEDGPDAEEETEDEETEEEEVLEKMIRVLEKMDKRISHLERENAGLKKQLSERMTVTTEPTTVAKSRPNSNLKLVKGSYNRPPVSTQYVANQRDVGSGVKKESQNTSVFSQGLNEVFENCNRIANKTR